MIRYHLSAKSLAALFRPEPVAETPTPKQFAARIAFYLNLPQECIFDVTSRSEIEDYLLASGPSASVPEFVRMTDLILFRPHATSIRSLPQLRPAA